MTRPSEIKPREDAALQIYQRVRLRERVNRHLQMPPDPRGQLGVRARRELLRTDVLERERLGERGRERQPERRPPDLPGDVLVNPLAERVRPGAARRPFRRAGLACVDPAFVERMPESGRQVACARGVHPPRVEPAAVEAGDVAGPRVGADPPRAAVKGVERSIRLRLHCFAPPHRAGRHTRDG